MLSRNRLIDTAVRTARSASKNQWMHPVAAFSAYTTPAALPTKTRPPTMTGCAYALWSPGNPNAHFTFRRPISLALNPAAAVFCRRVFELFAPHPFQAGSVAGLKFAGAVAHIACAVGLRLSGCENALPVTNSATARRSPAPMRLAIVTIG